VASHLRETRSANNIVRLPPVSMLLERQAAFNLEFQVEKIETHCT
jgi:hypothetical protein